jgi:hypothetical protein
VAIGSPSSGGCARSSRSREGRRPSGVAASARCARQVRGLTPLPAVACASR